MELLRLETVTFGDVTLSDINVVWCYVLSQYHSFTSLYTLLVHSGIRIRFNSYVLGLFHFSGMENLQMASPSSEEKIPDSIHCPASYRRL